MGNKPNDPGYDCPKCGGKAKIRSSEKQTRLSKKLYYQCLNIKCGHTWRASLSFDGTINPGLIDDTKLPAHRRLKVLNKEEAFETGNPAEG